MDRSLADTETMRALRGSTRRLERLPDLAPVEELFDPAQGVACARCGQPTGNFTQGHYWRYCKVTRRFEDEFHFCCPVPHGCGLLAQARR